MRIIKELLHRIMRNIRIMGIISRKFGDLGFWGIWESRRLSNYENIWYYSTFQRIMGFVKKSTAIELSDRQ